MPTWERDEYRITTEQFDLDAAERFLRQSYWASDRPREVLEQAFRQSTVFALFRLDEMVGMARVVSDGATFAWLCDVFVDPAHRGQALGDWLVGTVIGSGLFAETTRWLLATKDAHSLYARHGFHVLDDPSRWMSYRFRAPGL